MSVGVLILGLLPLVIFAILDSFYTLKTALVGAILAVVLEAGLSIYMLGEIDNLTTYNIILIGIFAFLAWKFDSARYFKFQPSFMSAIFGLVLIGSYAINKPLISMYITKYKDALTESMAGTGFNLDMVNNPTFVKVMDYNTLTLGVILILHSLITAWTAIKMGNFAWLMARLSIYPLMFIAVIAAKMMI